ncbi:nuclear transport factor 2 family protein [Sulfitobacter pseudonitzschiae]|uniref:Nuclear transport factor 2 family protein n=1 Tax=Pseudosulfitobacter pseudonitzschiae TaxID=1402135 RepID=A0A9Q2S1C4_9RHOB|nr:nuclear transport factor 2 family protein [Pseudosulfitobacter pseudonitzschiae]MBM2293510.1 nuclear transport factor 2 family protein [Pseudosulfitobacter pseudonitzschiae]MBM2298324.1 nuclear transport factor 2 family protein [Pseudosulfitobacter pseudonitzschiae]MBM2303238.1 nuclear transport factor 2 family protein [Pseudosulfitobacter pseudonitzschiae]MBM2313021.1 nuclear transport factor 2 family protein [Pseudosulfitobacter pseudonitzschiae]MBM2317934.1 nuclear transport factor 2 fam
MISSVYKAWHQRQSGASVNAPGSVAHGITRAGFLRLMATGAAGVALGGMALGGFAKAAGNTAPVTDLDGVYDAWQSRFNAGDLDGLMALYDADVTYINPDGVEMIGSADTRTDYAALLALKPKIDIGDRKHVVYKDISLTTNHWSLELTDPDGKLVNLTGGGIEVVRNIAGAGWLFIIDDASRSAS